MTTNVNLYQSAFVPRVEVIKHPEGGARFAVIVLGDLTVILPGDDFAAAGVLRDISVACLRACEELVMAGATEISGSLP